MVGLSDIPCVGKFLDRISDATVDPLFRGFNYMFCYQDHVNELNSKFGKLNIQEGSVSEKIVEKRADGKTIKDYVLKWQKEVEEIEDSVKEFTEIYKNRPSWRCIQCLPIPRPVSRFQLGKKAVHMAKRVTELSDFGKDLLNYEIAHLPPIENAPKSDTTFQNFQSRKDAYQKLWEALVTKGSSLILGIYGMPGVGKTRMMEQIWKEAKEKNIFDKVTRADVGSEKLDVIKLQNQIAGYLNCHFNSQDNVDLRASQLKNSLMNGGKILVILDDVWREIPLDVIGISFGDGSSSRGCKILFTSREEDLMKRGICLGTLLVLLKLMNPWHKKCVINVQAYHFSFTRLVKHYNLSLTILGQLEKGKVENIAGIDPRVYTCVKLSIDRLPDDAKSCLFLCSLYPEDAVIHVKKLIQLVAGLRLVPDGESRVCAMVDILRSSSLLLNSKEDHQIKLHDLIRDVARSIAVRDPKYSFLFLRCSSRLPDDVDYCTRKLLHLHLEKKDIDFPDGLVCPDLHNLWMQCNTYTQQFSSGFFDMFANLRFLLIQGMVSSLELQLSLQLLGKLRTIILDDCDMTHVNQTDVSLFPNNLETLCIWDCHLPVLLDLSKLKHLRKLEIKGNRTAVQMVPNTILGMPSLEELHIPDGFEYSVPILVEISKLTGLKSLQMLFRDSESFQDTNIFGNLLEFNICVGKPEGTDRYLLNSSVSIKKFIELYGNQLEGWQSLIKRAEVVILHCTNINVSSIYNSNRDAFTDLRNLYISGYNTMRHLVKISKDEIQISRQPRTSFSKLTTLQVRDCSAIKYLFSNAVVKCLVQLQKLVIANCPVTEAIIMNEGTSDGDIINFSKLKVLWLADLPRLKSFYREKKDRHSSSTSIMCNPANPSVQSQPLFNGMVEFPSLEELDIWNLGDTSDIWGNYYCNDNNVSSFGKLKTLKVFWCRKLESVIPLAMLHRLRNLEYLGIWYCHSLRSVFLPSIASDLMHLKEMIVESCDMMREIIGAGEHEEITEGIVFPELQVLNLTSLPNLSSFWGYNYQSGEANKYKAEFPNLVDFHLYHVEINLEEIRLGKDDSTWQIRRLGIEYDQETEIPCKWLLGLSNVEELTLGSCWSNELNSHCFERLKVLKVHRSRCSTLFTFSVFTSLKLQTLEISNCALLEEIVEDIMHDEVSGTNKKTITLSQLRIVNLKDLPKLKSFIHGANYRCHMPALTAMRVDNCGLSTLFSCSVFRELQNLENLEVSNCRLLEGIVDDVRNDETSFTNGRVITVFQLSLLYLIDLPNLKSFSSTSSYAFNMPALFLFHLRRCPQLESFTALKTSTTLVSVHSEWHQGKEFSDLNDYVRQYRQRGSNLSANSGKSSCSNQELETESERIGEVKLQETEKIDQP